MRQFYLPKNTLVFILIFLFSSSGAWAKEKESPIICNGDKVEFLEAKQELSAEGNVRVFFEDVRITCDKIKISMATKEGIAEGNVVLYQKDSVLTGNKCEYNFADATGTIYKAGFASQLIHGKAPKAVKEGPNEVTMRNSYMTTCDFDRPHYRIQAKTARIFLDDKVVMKHVVVYLANSPIFYLPYYSYDLHPDRPRVTILPGKDKDWGYYLLTAWRYEFNRYIKGLLHLDYRERKDFASGFDNYYTTKGYGDGFVKTYYMNERTLEKKHHWKQPRISHERERYMIHSRHSWDIDEDTDFRLEYWNVSDTDLLKDYFYRNDYERNPDPESYFSLVRTRDNYAASLVGKRRFNKIFRRVEYQPELRFDVLDLRIGPKDSKYYWKSENSFANLSLKEAHPSHIDEDTVRIDSYNRISRVSKLGFLHITPYVGGRETYYTKDRYGEGDWFRGAFYTGVDVETKLYRIFNVSTDIWGLDINNLRHVITPRVGYDYVHRPTLASAKLVQFDGLDSISTLNRSTLSLENKLQTKRKGKTEDGEEIFEAMDLARFLVTTHYDYRLASGSKFSDINFDFEFTPFNWLGLEFDTSYDHLDDRFKTFNLDIYAEKNDKLKCGLGYRYAHESHSEGTFEISFKPTPLWKLGIYERFMFKGYPYTLKQINRLREQQYRIARDLHCWTSEILYTISRGEGESVYLVFRLKAFPEMPVEFGKSYHRPKAYSQDPIR
ncbi:MAG: LPS-assembly protein LptD [Candidatus Omnitrophota bacterium]|nr:MAG: LPS-assembly protein LptD [Candidatus Omnitrophota bacterium]